MELIITLLTMFAYVIPGFFIATFMHELGHVVVGIACGWKFLFITSGPLCIYRNDIRDRIRIGFNKKIMYWFGISATAPAKMKGDEDKVFAKILIGGPIGSLVFGAVCGAVFALTGLDFFIYTAMIAAAQGVSCLIPMKLKTGAVLNDGTRYMRLRSKGKDAQEEKAAVLIVYSKMAEPDSDYDEELARILTDSDDLATQYGGYYYLYLNAKAHEDLARMETLKGKLETIGREVPASVKNAYAME